jgi:flavin reductase (DIM6/NTAB) family NADH-FMN oxidoreductase RutF
MDAVSFSRAVSSFPTGAAILTAGNFGLTVNSLCALSVDPPLISVTLENGHLERLRQVGQFCISILREDQAALARRCAPPGTELDSGEIPGVAARLFCKLEQVVEAGGHAIVIGAVQSVADLGGKPLVWWRRTFFGVHLDYPFLASPEVLDEFVRDFAAGTLPKSAWTHSAHVGVSAWYAFDRDADDLFATMKQGILFFNTCVGTVNGPDGGYHETLTRFWSQTIDALVREGAFASRFEAAQAAVQRYGEDRDFHRLYYSFDVVRDRRARREWVAPDKTAPM